MFERRTKRVELYIYMMWLLVSDHSFIILSCVAAGETNKQWLLPSH